jgi:hypothetical protein
MIVRLLVSVNRMGSKETAREAIDLAVFNREHEINKKYVVGIEVSGDPRIGKFETFIDEL